MIAYLKARGQGKTLVSQVVLALDQAFRKYPPATTEKSTILVYSANRTLVEMIDAREGKKRMLENRPCSKKEESVALEDPIESELKKIEHSLPNVWLKDANLLDAKIDYISLIPITMGSRRDDVKFYLK